MSRSISLQLKDALEQAEGLSTQVNALKTERDQLSQMVEHRAVELAEAQETISKLREQFDTATKRDAEVCQELANALTEIEQLKAAAKTVTWTASEEAVRIVADIGVPPVTAETQPTAPTADDLWAQYNELNRKDSRAAGQFYQDKLRPLIFKEK